MKDQEPSRTKRSRGAERRTAKRAPNIDQCATCHNARVLPHPDQDRAESAVIPCSDCSQITRPIRRKYLADPTACPWCGGAIEADAAPDVDEGVVTQEIDCAECNRRWRELYRLVEMCDFYQLAAETVGLRKMRVGASWLKSPMEFR